MAENEKDQGKDKDPVKGKGEDKGKGLVLGKDAGKGEDKDKRKGLVLGKDAGKGADKDKGLDLGKGEDEGKDLAPGKGKREDNNPGKNEGIDKDSEEGEEKQKRIVPPPTKKGIFFRNLFYVSLLGLLVIGGLAFLSFQPQNLSDIEGYVSDSSVPPAGGPDLASVLENAYKNMAPVRITEEELNNYLRRTLAVEQGGLFKKFVKARGVWVRLEKGIAEVIIEREMNGRRHTVSMLFEPKQTKKEDGGISTAVGQKHGKWGRTRVLNGFMYLTYSSFEALQKAYAEETKLIWEKMLRKNFRIKVSDGLLELSPPEIEGQAAPSS